MANNNQKIRFSLTSDYDGKGFQQVLKDIDNTSKASAKASGGVQNLANAAAVLPGSMGQAAQSASGFVGTLKSLFSASAALPGPLKLIALAVGSITLGVQAGMKIVGNHAEEARKRVEKAANAIQSGIKSRLNWLRNKMDEDLAAIRDGIKNTISQFDKLIGRIDKIKSAKNEVTSAQNQNDVLLRQVNKNTQLASIDDENERAILQARLAEQEALEERNDIIKQNTANEKEADRNLKNAQDRQEKLEELVEQAKKARAKAEEDVANAKKTGTKDMEPFNDRLKKASENLAAVQEQLKDQQVNVKVAEEKRKAVLIHNENALLENENKIIELNDSTNRLIKAQEKAAKEQERNAEKTRLQNQIKKIQSNTDAQVTDINGQIKQRLANIELIDKAKDRTKKGMLADQMHHAGISGEGFKYTLDKNGNIASLKDWQRAQRYAGRAERDDQRAARAGAKDERDLQKAKDKQKSGKKLSKRDQDLLDWDKERGKEKELDEIKKLQEKKKKLQEDTNKEIKGIKDKLDNLTAN